MKSILFLGYSNVLKARVFPFIHSLGVSSISIAKFAGQEWDDKYKDIKIPVTRYDSYEEGLKHYDGNLVYISIVNSEHFKYARKSLEAGFNTIVDKPAAMTLKESEELVALAKLKNLLLSESTVYLFHPQMEFVKKLFMQNSEVPKLMTVYFTMPPFSEDNFRYRTELGGGAIMDTAPYASSICRYFFEDEPIKIVSVINEAREDGLVIEYSLIMKFPDKRCMIGHFGFNTEYINRVMLIGNRLNVSFDRAFTIPDTMVNKIHVVRMNEHRDLDAPAGNTFMIYLKEVFDKLENKDFNSYYQALLYDAKVRELINNK